MKDLLEEKKTAETFRVTINGYWDITNKEELPEYPGVYFVYETKPDAERKIFLFGRLIYIGEADNVRKIILSHEKFVAWLQTVRFGNEICFAAGKTEPLYSERIMAAYIFRHKPYLNDKYKFTFPFMPTRLVSRGKTKLLNTDFTLEMPY